MKSKITLNLILFFFSSSVLFSQNEPNIILIIADDMGWNQVSTPLTNLNNPSDFYETPTLETLASEGIAFPQAYVNGANCAPTRAALLSGQYAARSHNNIYNVEDLNRGNTSSNSTLIGPTMGLESNGNIDEIPSSAITIAETLKSAGYTTAHFGKYHVGEYEDANVSNNAPKDQGFDFNYGGGTDGGPGSGGYFASGSAPYAFGAQVGPELDAFAAPYTEAESIALSIDHANSPLTGTAKHLTDAMADAAIFFMDNNSSNPFFMHFSNYAIHGPFNSSDARSDLRAKYDAKAISNPGSMDHNSTPGQAALAEGMDQAIGRLIDYLKTTDDPRSPGKKLSENTLVYFISDNGDAVKRTPQAPLRGMKGEYYEGGIRSVTIAWSEASWLANKGSVNSTPIVAFDLYPTFVEAANGALPSNYDIDGVSQWQMLSNGTAMDSERPLYWHFPGYLLDSKRDARPVSVVRRGDYKLIYNYESSSYEFYNVINDIGESNNLLLGSPDSELLVNANEMSTLLINHLTETSAPLPTYRSDGTTVALPFVIDVGGASNSEAGCQAIAGYEAYWDFDYASNSNDASGNNHNPIATTGTLQFDTNDFKEGDRSAYFNGFTKIQYDSDPFLKIATSSRSVSLWVKPDGLNGLQNIFDEGGATKGVALRLNDSDIEFIVRSNGSTFEQVSAAFPNDGAWHQLVLVYDGGSTLMKLYLDGSEVASSNGAPASIGNHSGSGIGGKVGGADSFENREEQYFTGKMDAIAVYNGVLNPTQISNAFCANALPVVADAGADVSICNGDATTLAASGGTSYLWSTGATTASIEVSPSTTTQYTVTVSDGITSDNDDVVVTVNELPTANAGSAISICAGDSTTLTASGGDSYLWNTGATTASIDVSPTNTTTYTVTVSQNGCSSEDSVEVTVNNLPSADAGADVSICTGDMTTLTASGGASYLWNTGATTASIDVSPTDTTEYTVTVTQNGCSSQDSVTVTVNDLPIADAGQDTAICNGETTTLIASGGTSYLWSTGATSASIDVSPTETTTYTVTVSLNGCSSQDTIEVTVNDLPIANAGTDVTINEGDTTTLTATGGDSYLWNTGATAASIDVSPNTSTLYTVTVNQNGCTAEDDVQVTVNVPVVANAGADLSICNGETTTLTATGGTSYLWNTGATTASIAVSPNTTTRYTVTVSDGITSDSDDVEVTVNPIPVADAGPDASICAGETITLSASGGASYLWSTGATTATIEVSPNTTTSYSVVVSQNGCSSEDSVEVAVNPAPLADAGADVAICVGDSTTLTASGGDSYVWNTGETTSSINVSPTDTTVYTVTVTQNACSAQDSVEVTVNALPVANAGADIAICNGDSTVLTASGGDSYVWSTGATTASINVSPNSTTTYSVTVSQNGCSSEDSVEVAVNAAPIADAGSDVTINEGASTTLTATGGSSYVWSTGATTASINVSPSISTSYTVVVDQNGCTSSDDVFVTVIPSESCSYVVVNSEDFESGWGIWNDGGSDARRNANDAPYSNGTYSARLRDNTSTSVTTTDNLDLTSYEEITVDFGYYPRSMDNNTEDFWLQISTDGGANFTTLEEWNLNDEFVNDQFYTDQVVISGPFSSTTQFRFRADGSGNSDWVYIDDIVISGCLTSGAARSAPAQQNAAAVQIEAPSTVVDDSIEITTKLYPNPFTNQIIVEINGRFEKGQLTVFNLLGQAVYAEDIKGKNQVVIPAEQLQAGQYVVRLDLDEQTYYKRAIKK